MSSFKKMTSSHLLSQEGENLLKNCIITFSHIEPDLKEKLSIKIKKMKGKVVRELRKSVTHIISDDWFTKKCIYARKIQLPVVMRTDWIDACWEMKLAKIHFSLENFLEYKLPIFHGMKLCFSQIPFNERPVIKKIVEANGGQYLANLELNSTTHLVLLYNNGEKYEKARQVKNIKIVSYKWYLQSLKKKLPLFEDFFPPIENISHFIEEMNYNQNQSKLNLKLDVDDTILQATEDENKRLKQETCNNNNNQPLKGCFICISNTLLIRKQELRNLITELGGVFVDYLDTSTTHLIIEGPNIQTSFDYEKAKRLSIQIVDVNWLTKHKGPDYEKKRGKHFAESFSDFYQIQKRKSNLNIEVIKKKKAFQFVNSNSVDNNEDSVFFKAQKQKALRKSIENAQKLEKLLSNFENIKSKNSQSKDEPIEIVKSEARAKMNLNPRQDIISESLPVVWDS